MTTLSKIFKITMFVLGMIIGYSNVQAQEYDLTSENFQNYLKIIGDPKRAESLFYDAFQNITDQDRMPIALPDDHTFSIKVGHQGVERTISLTARNLKEFVAGCYLYLKPKEVTQELAENFHRSTFLLAQPSTMGLLKQILQKQGPFQNQLITSKLLTAETTFNHQIFCDVYKRVAAGITPSKIVRDFYLRDPDDSKIPSNATKYYSGILITTSNDGGEPCVLLPELSNGEGFIPIGSFCAQEEMSMNALEELKYSSFDLIKATEKELNASLWLEHFNNEVFYRLWIIDKPKGQVNLDAINQKLRTSTDTSARQFHLIPLSRIFVSQGIEPIPAQRQTETGTENIPIYPEFLQILEKNIDSLNNLIGILS